MRVHRKAAISRWAPAAGSSFRAQLLAQGLPGRPWGRAIGKSVIDGAGHPGGVGGLDEFREEMVLGEGAPGRDPGILFGAVFPEMVMGIEHGDPTNV